jgi:hypothetical protein
MKKIRIRDLPNWPPDPGGPYQSSYRSPTSEQAILRRVEPKRVDGLVTFVGEFEGHSHTYDYRASSERLAEAIRKVVGQHLRTSVFGLGELEIDVEPGEQSAA